METTTAISLLAGISRFTALEFVSGLWQGMVLISAVAVCLRLLPRASASVRFAVWGFAFALIAAMPLLHLMPLLGAPLHIQVPAVRQPEAPVVHLGAAWGFAIAGIWALCMAVRAARLAVQAYRLRRIWGRAKPVVAEGSTLALLQQGRRRAQLCLSSDVDSPSVIGFFAPRLLIPEAVFANLTRAELRQIVLHECEHLRRCDDWMNLLQKIALTLFPLNPALLWVDRRLSLERELACDAGVVALTAAPFEYANCLVRLAEDRIRCRRVALSLSAWSRQSEVAQRVQTLLRPMRKMAPLQARISIALLGVGLVGGAVEMARVPGVVSFADVATTAPVETGLSPGAVSLNTVQRQLPIAYRETARDTAHATLQKAALTSQGTRRIPSHAAPTNKQQHVNLHRVRVARMQQQPRLVLTTATPEDMLQPDSSSRALRPVYMLSIEFSPTYTAVPFGDGWLIVQL